MDLFSKKRISFQTGTVCLFACLALLSVSAHGGGIYKWVDEEGNIHYSQDPPQNKSAEPLNIKVPKSSAAGEETTDASEDTAASKSSAENDDKTNKQKILEEAQAAAKKREEAEKKNCQIAMKRLATISAGGRLYEVDESGERHYWDDQTLQAKKAEAQKDVDQWCGQE